MSDKKFIIILIILGILYFVFRGGESNVDQTKVSFQTEEGIKSFENYKGQNLVVNFYASWCGPCMNEMPALTKTPHEWNDVTFLWITSDSKKDIDKVKNRFSIDNVFEVATSFRDIGVKTIPHTIILNKKGEVVLAKGGELNWNNESFKQSILKLFEE